VAVAWQSLSPLLAGLGGDLGFVFGSGVKASFLLVVKRRETAWTGAKRCSCGYGARATWSAVKSFYAAGSTP
jgi:hypothetical protein